MIWIDFGIICIGQEQISVPADMNDIVFEGYQRTADSEPFYSKDYHFHTADNLLGCLYNIWLPESICYEESFFDKNLIDSVITVDDKDAINMSIKDFKATLFIENLNNYF